jgi:hypothetical protein
MDDSCICQTVSVPRQSRGITSEFMHQFKLEAASVRGARGREGLLVCLRVAILLVIAVCCVVEIRLSGVCLRNYGYSFIFLYTRASMLCLCLCVAGIMLICSAHFVRRTDVGRVLQRGAWAGLWVPMATQYVVIPVVWLLVLSMWPGWDDGGGFG